MNPWEESWDTKAVKLSFDDALKAEGVSGKAADIARSIYQQESSSGKNTKTSNAGAVGGMQIIPATFKSVADKDWDINDPFHNSRAGVRYVKQLFEQAGGDPSLTAAGYYGGPGGLEKARRGVAVSDPRNPNAPTTLQYGQQVAARLPKEKGLLQRGVEAVIPSAQAAETSTTQAKMPWEEQWEAPAKATNETPQEAGGAAFGVYPKARRDVKNNQQDALGSIAKGVASGFADVGNTITNAGTKAAAGAIPSQPDMLIDPRLQRGSAGQQSPAEQDNAQRAQGLQAFNEDNKGALFSGGRIAGNIAATLPVGGVLGGVAKAAGLPMLGNALASGGMTTGTSAAPGLAGGAANMGVRMLGGGITGGAVSGLIDPNAAATGALVGAALPPVVKGLGALGSSAGRVVRGPEVPEGVRTAAAAAREAGYVIPPTQVRPTLGNRLLEGTAGKLTTAQNASAANQQVTNRLARQAIGAEELTPEALQAVRNRANEAYTALAQAGQFSADDAFREALKKAGAPSAQLQKDFPALANSELSGLVKSFSNTKEFDAQSAIEAIKVMRAAQRASVGSQDPAAVAMGRAQGKIANALEDLVDRNLAGAGNQDLLGAYRQARQTLAKVYDLEKALNPASGNVDAKKVANLLKKGRLTGELKQIGEFAGSFPKAAQTLEGMGSLPQTSPLDWTAAGGIAAATGGSPVAALGLVARPAARAAALSPFVQNRLAAPPGLPMLTQNVRQNLLQPVYRAGPVLATDR
jgi:hypothetical protein